MPITIGYWDYSRNRVIGNVVDLIGEPRKNGSYTIIVINFNNKNILRKIISIYLRQWLFWFIRRKLSVLSI